MLILKKNSQKESIVNEIDRLAIKEMKWSDIAQNLHGLPINTIKPISEHVVNLRNKKAKLLEKLYRLQMMEN